MLHLLHTVSRQSFFFSHKSRLTYRTRLSDFLRRPTALSFSESLSECLEELETSPYAVQLDSRLAAWVRLHQIHEEVATFSVGNGEAARRPHGDKHTQYILAAFEKRIADWEASLAPGVMNRGPILISVQPPTLLLIVSTQHAWLSHFMVTTSSSTRLHCTSTMPHTSSGRLFCSDAGWVQSSRVGDGSPW